MVHEVAIYSRANTLGTTPPHLNLQACSVCPVCCTDCRTQAAGTTCKQTSEGFTQNYNNKGENGCCRCLFISEKNSEIDMPHLHIHFVSAGSERAKYFEIIFRIELPHLSFWDPYPHPLPGGSCRRIRDARNYGWMCWQWSSQHKNASEF